MGTYAALGDRGFEVEALTMQELGLAAPEPADWKGTRDKHAEWGCLIAIMAKSQARMAQDIFLLQGDDFGELDEGNTEVGSSTMPHKSNPVAAISAPKPAVRVSSWRTRIFEVRATLSSTASRL